MTDSTQLQELNALKQAVRLNPDSIEIHGSRIAQLTEVIRSNEARVVNPTIVAQDRCKQHN